MRLLDVLGCHVVLKVDPGPRWGLFDVPEGRNLGRFILGLESLRRAGFAKINGHRRRCFAAAVQRRGKCERTIGCARDGHAGRQSFARYEGGDVITPDRAAAMVTGQVDIRRPTAGNRKAIHLYAAALVERDRGQALAPVGVQHDVARTAVDDLDHVDTLGAQVFCCPQPVVVVGEDCNAFAWCHAKAVHIGAHRAREHDPGPVVVAKGDRPLGCPGAQQCTLGIDPPKHLSRLAARFGQMISLAFQRAIDAVIERAIDSRAWHDPHVVHRCQFLCRVGGPIRARFAIDLQCFGVQATAKAKILVRQQHTQPRAPGSQRRRQTCGAAANDQKIAMQIPVIILIGVFQHRQAAQPGRGADEGFIDLFPKRLGPHEGLVIEPCAEERREQIVQAQQIPFKRATVVLTGGFKPGKKLDRGGAGVGFLCGAAAQLHQRIGFFGPGRKDAARAVIFERPPDKALAVGQ